MSTMSHSVTLEEEPFHPRTEEPPLEEEDIEGEILEEEDIEYEEVDEEVEDEEAGGGIDSRLGKALELNARVVKARTEYDAAAEAARSKKKLWEAYSEELSDYLRSLTEEMPLFDRKPEKKESPKEPEPTIDGPPTGWEGTQLAGIEGLPKNAAASLEEVGIVCLGQLADFTKTQRLTDIAGIGPAAAEKIENALAGFWKAWGEKYPEKQT